MKTLASINKKIDGLKNEFSSIKYILRGSIKKVFNKCGKKECICHRDPDKFHGPYYHFTKKVKGKTTGKHYSKEEAEFLDPYLKKYNGIQEIIKEISELSDKAIEIIINDKKTQLLKDKQSKQKKSK